MVRPKRNDEIVLQRISKTNMARILALEPMQVGDSLDNVLSKVLDKCEKKKFTKEG